MIGSANDLSAVYYNPGAIALLGDQGFILSARAYRFAALTLEDGAGPGVDLASSSTRPLPTMFAGSLRFGWLGRSRLSYSLLTRQQFDADLAGSRIESRDVLPAAGAEDLATAFTANVAISDLWAGLTWSHPLGERVGFGVTQFFAIRNQSLGSQLLAQVATQAGDVSIGTRLRKRSFTHYRTLWKAGLSLDLGAVTAGFTVTTPSVGLGGSGSSVYNSSVSGLDVDGDGNDDPFLASNLQQGVKAGFKSSVALGAGAAYGFGDTRVHVSAEWFGAQDLFTLLDTDAFTGQTSGQPIENDLTGELASVLNWAVGLEHAIGGRVSLYASYATDRSAATSDASSDFVMTEYDISRVGGGASFVVVGAEITLGLLWAGGSGPFPQLIALGDLDIPDVLLSGDDDANLRFRQWTVVLGFELAR